MGAARERERQKLAAQHRSGLIVAECWANAGEFDDPAEFLAALTEVLDDHCTVYDKPLPGDFARIFGTRLQVAS